MEGGRHHTFRKLTQAPAHQLDKVAFGHAHTMLNKVQVKLGHHGGGARIKRGHVARLEPRAHGGEPSSLVPVPHARGGVGGHAGGMGPNAHPAAVLRI